MIVMFHDIHNDIESKLSGRTLDYLNHWELVYAGDTMLIGKGARGINILIAAIEQNRKNTTLNEITINATTLV